MSEHLPPPNDIPDWGWWLSQHVDRRFEELSAEVAPLTRFQAAHEAQHEERDRSAKKVMGVLGTIGTAVGALVGAIVTAIIGQR